MSPDRHTAVFTEPGRHRAGGDPYRRGIRILQHIAAGLATIVVLGVGWRIGGGFTTTAGAPLTPLGTVAPDPTTTLPDPVTPTPEPAPTSDADPGPVAPTVDPDPAPSPVQVVPVPIITAPPAPSPSPPPLLVEPVEPVTITPDPTPTRTKQPRHHRTSHNPPANTPDDTVAQQDPPALITIGGLP